MLNCIERNFTMKMKSATLGTPEYQFRRCFSCQSLILGLSDKFQCSKTNHRAKSLLVIRCFSVLLYQVKFHPQDEIRRFRDTSIWIQQVFFLPYPYPWLLCQVLRHKYESQCKKATRDPLFWCSTVSSAISLWRWNLTLWGPLPINSAVSFRAETIIADLIHKNKRTYDIWGKGTPLFCLRNRRRYCRQFTEKGKFITWRLELLLCQPESAENTETKGGPIT